MSPPSSGCRARATQKAAFRDDYAANLRNLIASVRRDFNNPNLPFVFGQIIDFGSTESTILRAQQQAVADDNTVDQHGIHI